MSPSFNPQTGLFYFNAWRGDSMWYLSPGARPTDHQGGGTDPLVATSVLLALDYQTGKIRWQRESGKGLVGASVLNTAGHLLFTADASGNLLALDPADGHVLWHTQAWWFGRYAAPMTYELDGTQYVVTGVDGVLYAWSLTGELANSQRRWRSRVRWCDATNDRAVNVDHSQRSSFQS